MKENMSEIELTHEDVNQLFNIVEAYADNELCSESAAPSVLSLLEKLEKHI